MFVLTVRSCGHGHGHGVSRSEPPVRRRRSQQLQIDLKTHCLFCAEECLPADPKHPDRHKHFSLCETVEMLGMKTFKDSVLDSSARRNDEWDYQVDVRIRGEAGLIKAEARYHNLCYDRLYKLPCASCTRRCVKPSHVDAALASCIDYM